MHEEVFSTKEFATWAGKNVVLLEVDFPQNKKQSDERKAQNKELQATYKIEGYPTIVFLDAEGKEVGRSGYAPGGPKAWIKEAEAAMNPGAGDAKEGANGKVAAEGDAWRTELPDELAKQNKDLAAKYAIQGDPTILFLDAKGEKIEQSGYLEGGPATWIADAEKKLGIKSKKKAKKGS